MRSKQVAKLLSYKFFTQLTSLSFVKSIILFGSRAKGNNDERADIDLAIECPSATSFNWNSIMEIIENADTLLTIDCVRFDRIQSKTFKNAILDNQIVLFKRKKVL